MDVYVVYYDNEDWQSFDLSYWSTLELAEEAMKVAFAHAEVGERYWVERRSVGE